MNNLSFPAHLAQYQVDFINQFLGDNSPAYQRLVAPDGMGKSATAYHIIQQSIANHGAKQILFLSPRKIPLEYHRDALQSMELPLPIELVDSRYFREMISKVEPNRNPWSESILALVVVSGVQAPYLLESILQNFWDLIVIDIHSWFMDQPRRSFINGIIQNPPAKKLLILDNTDQSPKGKEIETIINNIPTTLWTQRTLADDWPASHDIKLQINVINYQFTPEEVAFIDKYMKLWENNEKAEFLKSISQHQVLSSIYAAERSLREKRNKLAHYNVFSFIGSPDDETAEIDQEPSNISNWFPTDSDRGLFLKNANELLHLLDKMPVDSKFETLTNYLGQVHIDKPILISCNYSDTVSYLHSSLSEIYENTFAITTSSKTKQIRQTLDEFRDHGGLLIATPTMLTGIDLNLEEVIFYDIPNNQVFPKQIVAKLYSPWDSNNISKTKIVSVLHDQSQTIQQEEAQLRRFQRIVQEFSL